MTAHVLIVEDEPAIAFEIESSLRQAGYAITACVGSVDKALDVIERRECDIALLDINLRGKSVRPVVTALRRRGTPFLFVSGFERVHLPEQFSDAPLLTKPFDPADLIRCVRQLLAQTP
jgi:DNA-binding response OmpR family regulator